MLFGFLFFDNFFVGAELLVVGQLEIHEEGDAEAVGVDSVG